jgi:hypothetical protein
MAVRQLLQKQYGLKPVAVAQRAVLTYRAELAKTGVGDEIYHAPIEETAEGIVKGGYVTSGRSARSGKRAKRSQTTHQGSS